MKTSFLINSIFVLFLYLSERTLTLSSRSYIRKSPQNSANGNSDTSENNSSSSSKKKFNVNDFNFNFTRCAGYNESCYSEGLFLMAPNHNKANNHKKDLNEPPTPTESFLQESVGPVLCSPETFYIGNPIDYKNYSCFTAQEGNNNLVALIDSVIPRVNYERVCRLVNESNYLSDPVIVPTNTRGYCNRTTFNKEEGDQIDQPYSSTNPHSKLNANFTKYKEGLSEEARDAANDKAEEKGTEKGCSCAKIYRNNWKYCAKQDNSCKSSGVVRYGQSYDYVYKFLNKAFICDNVTLGQTKSKDKNFCWLLEENPSNDVYYNFKEIIPKGETYKACSLVVNGKENAPRIFNPKEEVECNTFSFNAAPMVNEEKFDVACRCSYFVY